MAITCPKCGYQRHPGDPAPDDECPRCGIVYARYRARRQAENGGEDGPPPPHHTLPGRPAAAPVLPPSRAPSPALRRGLLVLGLLLPGLLMLWGYKHYYRGPGEGVPMAAGLAINGAPYRVKLAPTRATIRILEDVGFSAPLLYYTIIFPLPTPGPFPRPGLAVSLDPGKITPGELIPFGHANPDSGIGMEFSPGFPLRQGGVAGPVELIYTTGEAGGGIIRFDTLHPEIGGAVSGVILSARLHGVLINQETLDAQPPPSPKVLTIQDMPFQATFERSIF